MSSALGLHSVKSESHLFNEEQEYTSASWKESFVESRELATHSAVDSKSRLRVGCPRAATVWLPFGG